MSDLRDALDHILILCNRSTTYTRRVQNIHEVAMRALGLTAGQRQARHVAILERVSGAEALATYRERKKKRRLKAEAKKEECRFCGFRMRDPCEGPPPDYCTKALEEQQRQETTPP